MPHNENMSMATPEHHHHIIHPLISDCREWVPFLPSPLVSSFTRPRRHSPWMARLPSTWSCKVDDTYSRPQPDGTTGFSVASGGGASLACGVQLHLRRPIKSVFFPRQSYGKECRLNDKHAREEEEEAVVSSWRWCHYQEANSNLKGNLCIPLPHPHTVKAPTGTTHIRVSISTLRVIAAEK